MWHFKNWQRNSTMWYNQNNLQWKQVSLWRIKWGSTYGSFLLSFTNKRTTKHKPTYKKMILSYLYVWFLALRKVLGYSYDEGRLVIYFCCSFHDCSPLLSSSLFVVCSQTATFCFACVISRKIPKESLLGFGTIILALRQVLFLDLICSLFFQFIFLFSFL